MLTERQQALYELMSDISEECWCAGWMHGNEFVLWRLITDPGPPASYGQGAVSPSDIATMLRISDEIGGWIYWHDDESEPDLPPEEWGPRFIAADAWRRRYAQSMTPDP